MSLLPIECVRKHAVNVDDLAGGSCFELALKSARSALNDCGAGPDWQFYAYGFFAADGAGEYRGKLLLDNLDYSSPAPTQTYFPL